MTVGAVLDQLAVLDDRDLSAGEAVLDGGVHEIVDHIQGGGVHAHVLGLTLDDNGVTGADGDDLVLAHGGDVGNLNGVDAVHGDVSDVDLVGLAAFHALGLDLDVVDKQTQRGDGCVQGDVDLALVTVTVEAAQAVDGQGVVGTVGECAVHLPILLRQRNLGDALVTGGGAGCQGDRHDGENHHDGQQQGNQLARCLFHLRYSLRFLYAAFGSTFWLHYSKMSKYWQGISGRLVHYSHTGNKSFQHFQNGETYFTRLRNCFF